MVSPRGTLPVYVWEGNVEDKACVCVCVYTYNTFMCIM